MIINLCFTLILLFNTIIFYSYCFSLFLYRIVILLIQFERGKYFTLFISNKLDYYKIGKLTVDL